MGFTTMFRSARLLFLLALTVFFASCRVQVVVPEGGRVVANSPANTCDESRVCTVNVSDTSFDDTFTAVANNGYVFKGWRKDNRYFCGGSTAPCRLATSGFAGNPHLMALLEGDSRFYLEPVFEPVTVSGSFRVGGMVKGSTTASADSDVNDVNHINITNNTLSTAQSIGNPTTVGGHANTEAYSVKGQTAVGGDKDDYFAVDLVKGQVINLIVSDPDTGDLDLYLFDSAGISAGYSQETSYYEQVTAPGTGRYYVNVYAFQGGSNYVLSIGQAANPNAHAKRSFFPEADFELDHAIVKYNACAKHSCVLQAQSASAIGNNAAAASHPVRVSLNKSTLQSVQSATAKKKVYPKTGLKFTDKRMEKKWETHSKIKQLAAQDDVDYAEPNFIRNTMAVTPNDKYYSYQWHYPMIDLPDAWEVTTGSPNVIVAVADTGVLLNHSDMQGQLVSGYDFVSDVSMSGDGDGMDANPNDPGDSDDNQPSSFHGTHVAGTVAAATNNGQGVAGVAWGARIMPIRVLGTGGGTTADIIAGVRYAAGLSNASGRLPARRADIINLSLGGPGYSAAAQETFDEVYRAGVIVIAAAGNEGNSIPNFPASYDNVVSVSAVAMDGSLAPYSSYGSTVDIAAPGGDSSVDNNGDGYGDGVLSAAGDDSDGTIKQTYSFQNGTSMASPHMAGVVALMKSVNPSLTPAQLDNLIASGALSVEAGSAGRDNYYGWGIVNAYKAVTNAKGDGSQPPGGGDPRSNVSPREIALLGTSATGTFTISNSGSGTLVVNSVRPRDNWLRVTTANVDSHGVGSYTVRVSGTPPQAVSSSAIEIRTNGGNYTLSVLVGQPTAGNNGGNVGVVYFLLVNESSQVVESIGYRPDGSGEYPYQFESVPAGNYFLFAGTDQNNNNLICEPGEACGSYLTMEQPLVIRVGSDISNVDFSVSYQSDVSSQAASAGGVKAAGKGFQLPMNKRKLVK